MDSKTLSKKAIATTPVNSGDKPAKKSKEMKSKKQTKKATTKTTTTKSKRTPLVERTLKVLNKEPKLNKDSTRHKCFGAIRNGMKVGEFLKVVAKKGIKEPSAMVALKKMASRDYISLS